MDDMEGKIVLDRKSFEALAVDSRVRILKSLKERRKTLSEVASEQKMSLSGVKEHLETLEKVGLIVKRDDGHKWKYYELTKKGMDIVAPRELRVWILLSLSTIALVASMFALFSVPEPMMQNAAYGGALPGAERAMEPAPMLATAVADSAIGAETSAEDAAGGNDVPPPDGSVMAAKEATLTDGVEGLPIDESVPMQETPAPSPVVPMVVAAISGLTLVGCLAILARNRIRFTSP